MALFISACTKTTPTILELEKLSLTIPQQAQYQELEDKTIVISSANFQGEGQFSTTWDEVKEGYKMVIYKDSNLVMKEDDEWILTAGESIGEVISEEETTLGNTPVYLVTMEGNGFLGEYEESHTMYIVGFESPEKETYQIWTLSKTSTKELTLQAIEDVINNFNWNN